MAELLVRAFIDGMPEPKRLLVALRDQLRRLLPASTRPPQQPTATTITMVTHAAGVPDRYGNACGHLHRTPNQYASAPRLDALACVPASPWSGVGPHKAKVVVRRARTPLRQLPLSRLLVQLPGELLPVPAFTHRLVFRVLEVLMPPSLESLMCSGRAQ